MKKFVIAFLALSTSLFASASEITVMNAPVPYTRGFTTVDTRFYIDTDMKEGFAKVSVQEEYYDHSYSRCWGGYGPYGPGRYGYPGGYYCGGPSRYYHEVFSDTVKIEGLTTNGDEVIYQGPEGDVLCGRMGTSRVLKRPTFYLSGKCQLEGKIYLENGQKKVVVKFKTK